MIMRKKVVLSAWMLLTIGAMMLTSCSDTIDNPVEPVNPDQPSVVDNGKWTIDDSNMDLSVKPGDNFFMYCNGTWWKNAQVEQEEPDIVGFGNDNESAWTEAVQALPHPTLAQIVKHVADLDQTQDKAIATYQDVIEKSGLMTATTKEEVWRAIGKLTTLGVSTFVNFSTVSYQGKMRLVVEGAEPEIFCGETSESDENHDDDDEMTIKKMIRKDPRLLQALVPLTGNKNTRSVADSSFPMLVTIIEAMGLDPSTILMPSEYAATGNVELNDQIKAQLAMIDMAFRTYQDLDADEMKKEIMSFVNVDAAFLSSKALEDFNNQLQEEAAKEGKEVGKVDMGNLLEGLGKYMCYSNSKIAVDNFVTADMKERGAKICEALGKVFQARIEANDWMSDGSKRNAIEKLQNMTYYIGGPDKWIEEGLPDVSDSESLLEDIYRLRKARLNLLKAIEGMDTKKGCIHEVASDPQSKLDMANAMYVQNFNAFFIFPYFLNAPFYDPSQNEAFNYGTYTVFAHEITHGFDTRGAQYNKNGDYGPIWANEADSQEFLRRAGKLSAWYSSFDLLPDEMPGVKANGEGTITEDIADLGGFEIAFQLYTDKLKADGFKDEQMRLQQQRFFRAYAELWRAKYNPSYVQTVAFGLFNPNGPDVHSLEKERINALIPNTDAWYDLFDVLPGDKLYLAPGERVHIW